MKKWSVFPALLLALNLQAQHPEHEHHGHAQPDTAKHKMRHDEMMSSQFSRSLPMNRNGSGTAWQPDSTPMFGDMRHLGEWMFMLHGNLFLRYTSQNLNNDGKRADSRQLDAPNWAMLMLQRPTGANGQFSASLMLSLDRLTMGGNGYPLLLQSGETWQGEPLVDRQHPHELFSGISIGYSHRLSERVDVFGYLGYPGEPALGPGAFMHRASALSNPDAPLGHHWQDATHIIFGVGTLGFRFGILKLEGSIFTGREPDENRYDFDKPLFDSYSYRLSLNPSPALTLQFSQGFLNEPEALHPGDVTRTTASVLHGVNWNRESGLYSSLIYGLNASDHADEHSITLESNLLLGRTNLYGRYEFVQKSAEELALEEFEDEKFNLHAFTAGAAWRLASFGKLNLHLGGQATLNQVPENLEDTYGSMPISGQVYLRINPRRI